MTQALQDRDASRDFDFLLGRWHARNRRLVERLQGWTTWETFDATYHVKPVLGGLGNVGEYRTDHWPGFAGLSLRVFNPATRKWSIYWANNRDGVLEPPVVGSFSNGVGIFEGRDELRGRPILVRYTWSNITKTSARWEQAFSPDSGQTWETNWIMEFTRRGDG